MVSTKHANFILNRGHAKSADIEALIHRISEKVKSQCGLSLELEVHVYPK